MGVPEVWRYDGERMTILVLESSGYAETEESLVLRPITPRQNIGPAGGSRT